MKSWEIETRVRRACEEHGLDPPPPITPIDEQRAHLLAKACGCCKED